MSANMPKGLAASRYATQAGTPSKYEPKVANPHLVSQSSTKTAASEILPASSITPRLSTSRYASKSNMGRELPSTLQTLTLTAGFNPSVLATLSSAVGILATPAAHKASKIGTDGVAASKYAVDAPNSHRVAKPAGHAPAELAEPSAAHSEIPKASTSLNNVVPAPPAPATLAAEAIFFSKPETSQVESTSKPRITTHAGDWSSVFDFERMEDDEDLGATLYGRIDAGEKVHAAYETAGKAKPLAVQLLKRVMCKAWRKGKCTLGDECNYRHSEEGSVSKKGAK